MKISAKNTDHEKSESVVGFLKRKRYFPNTLGVFFLASLAAFFSFGVNSGFFFESFLLF